jgi:hypothetical protein
MPCGGAADELKMDRERLLVLRLRRRSAGAAAVAR